MLTQAGSITQKTSQVSKTVFAIGTKNTQERDLAYLENVKLN